MPRRNHNDTYSNPGPITASGRFQDSARDTQAAPQHTTRRRIDRRLPEISTPTDTEVDDLLVTFPHRPGTKAKPYDFGSLEIPQDIAALLAHAARHHPEPLAYETQRSLWGQISIFARFVREDSHIGSVADVNTAMINRYRAWLDQHTHSRTGAPWGQKTRANALVALRTLIKTAKAVCPERLSSTIVFPAHCYPHREPPQPRQRLDNQQLKALLWSCQQEITQIRARLRTARQILNKDECVSHDPHLVDMLNVMNDLRTPISFPTWETVRHEMRERGIKRDTLTKLGRMRDLLSYLSLTPDTAAPYFISLLIQLAGNVEPIRLLTRDCAHPDPTRDHWKTIEWEKARSGRALQRTQVRSFPSTRPYGPPMLVADLLTLTEPLVSRVPPGDQHRLFLAWNCYEKTFGVITYAALEGATRRFLSRSAARIDEWNRQRPDRQRAPLPDFQLRDLRGSAATQHYVSSGGDIRHTQQILNHASADTTELYINGPQTSDLDSKILASIVQQLVDHICNNTALTDRSTLPEDWSGTATASFSNDCKKPMVPSMLGQPRLCPHFQQCLDCPGLVIPIDAIHFARILRAINAFESAHERLHPERWRLFYANSYQTLKDLLQEFPESLLPEAQRLLSSLAPLPELE